MNDWLSHLFDRFIHWSQLFFNQIAKLLDYIIVARQIADHAGDFKKLTLQRFDIVWYVHCLLGRVEWLEQLRSVWAEVFEFVYDF